MLICSTEMDSPRISACEVEALLADPSPLVRGAAVWAVGRLVSAERFAELASRGRANEPDISVTDEWNADLAS